MFHAPNAAVSLRLLNFEAQHTIKITAAGSSGTLFCTELTMERLFSPCTRMHDILESQGRLEEFIGRNRNNPEWLQELNLDVSTDAFLSAESGFTFADLHAMLGNDYTAAWSAPTTQSLTWLTPHASVAREGGILVQSWGSCCFNFNADGKEIVVLARSPEHLLEICDVVLRLLAASVVHSVILHIYGSRDGALINAPTLAYLMEQCQSLKVLTLENVNALDEDQIRVLGTCSRPGLEIELENCRLTSDGSSALAEILGRNQGPTKLHLCNVDNFVLANGLRGNSRLKSLIPRISNNRGLGNREVLAFAGALRENKGLVDLDLRWYDFTMSDDTWDAVCDSLKAHPTLQFFDLRETWTFGFGTIYPPSALKSRIQALVDMLKVNMSIHTLPLNPHYRQHKLFRRSVIPCLKTNRFRFRPRVRAIQKTRPIAYRTKVLGRALLAVRTDPNRFWMLLSGNPEVAFPSTTANLPTSATDAVTATTTVTATRETGASDVATPTACQKRKARP
jgi:hypothetical protein